MAASASPQWNDVSDLDEKTLFRAIYEYAYSGPFDVNRFSYEEMKKEMHRCNGIDWYNGRCLKFRMKGSVIDFYATYDRDSKKPMKEVVDMVRKGLFVPNAAVGTTDVKTADVEFMKKVKATDNDTYFKMEACGVTQPAITSKSPNLCRVLNMADYMRQITANLE